MYSSMWAHSPLPLLLQQVGEVVALVHEVGVFAFLVVQLHHRPPVTFLSQQQLLQHPSVRLLLFVFQTVQLRTKKTHVNTRYRQQLTLMTQHHKHLPAQYPEPLATAELVLCLWANNEQRDSVHTVMSFILKCSHRADFTEREIIFSTHKGARSSPLL